MKRLILALAAMLAVTASAVAVDLAYADDQGGPRAERGGGGRGWDRGDRGRGRFEERRRDGDRGRGWGEGRRRWDDDRRGSRYDDGPRGYGPSYARPPAYRPGGRLPPAYRGAVVQDYARYRLRPPPHGYAWFRAPGAFMLVSLVDGRVFDVIPD